MSDANWKMTSLKIELKTYGEHKGQYVGKIEFERGDEMSFSFALRPEMTAPYIHLIANEVAASANHLGEKLIQSFRPDPPAHPTGEGE